MVDEDVGLAAGAKDDGAVLAAERGPDDVGRADGAGAGAGDQGDARGRENVEGILGQAVVHAAAIGTADLVGEDEVVVGEFGDDGHAGARLISIWVVDIVDGIAPGLEVRSHLVGKLLAVLGVALVGVVDDELAVVKAV